MLGGSVNGDLLSVEPETGELTEVASAKRAVRATFSEEVVEEPEPVREDLVDTAGALFSDGSAKPTDCGALFPLTISMGETGSNDWCCWRKGIDR